MTDNSLKKTGENFNEKSTHENKQIIIDGVDVSGCKHLRKDDDNTCELTMTELYDRDSCCYSYCAGVDCIYKQISRKKEMYNKAKEDLGLLNSKLHAKTQECEELKSHIKEWFDYVNKVRFWITEASENLELDPTHSFGPKHFTFAVRCLKEKYTKILDENARYKQALESIEDICSVAYRYEVEELQEIFIDIIDEVKNAR